MSTQFDMGRPEDNIRAAKSGNALKRPSRILQQLHVKHLIRRSASGAAPD